MTLSSKQLSRSSYTNGCYTNENITSSTKRENYIFSEKKIRVLESTETKQKYLMLAFLKGKPSLTDLLFDGSVYEYSKSTNLIKYYQF